MEQIKIRSIQHYLYCPHRWGLIEIGQLWQENTFVVQGNLVHQRVDSRLHDFKSADKAAISSLDIFDDTLEIYGVADCVEFVKSKSGVYIEPLSGKYNVKIIEYKPRQKKSDEAALSEKMQLFAQKLCVDKLFDCNSETYFYYTDTKKRIRIDFSESLDDFKNLLIETLTEMRSHLQSGSIPPIKKNRHCSGCSMKDQCLPGKHKYNVKQAIYDAEGDI